MPKHYTDLLPYIYAMNHSDLKVPELLEGQSMTALSVMKKSKGLDAVTKILKDALVTIGERKCSFDAVSSDEPLHEKKTCRIGKNHGKQNIWIYCCKDSDQHGKQAHKIWTQCDAVIEAGEQCRVKGGGAL